MSVFNDRSTGWWTLKTTVNGKDKRVKLRKATPAEPRKPIPADVAALAIERGSFFATKPHPTPHPTPQFESQRDGSSLRTAIESFFADYQATRRAGSAKRMRMILDHFGRFGDERKVSAIGDVTDEHIRQYFHYRLKQTDPRLKIKIRPQTAIDEISLMSGLFTYAIKRRIYSGSNPCSEPVKEIRKLYPKIEVSLQRNSVTTRPSKFGAQEGQSDVRLDNPGKRPGNLGATTEFR